MIPIGYETDSYVLMTPGTVCAVGAITVGAGANAAGFGGSDFVKAVLRIAVTATTGTYTSWGVVFQSSPDNGTTWYPSFTGAGTGIAVGGGTSVGYYQVGTTCAVGLSQLVAAIFPGNLFRVGITGLGGTSITAGITADLQKYVPDAT